MKVKTKKQDLELTIAKYIKKVEEQNTEIRRLNRRLTGYAQTERIYSAYLVWAFSALGRPAPENMKAPDGTERQDGDIYAEIPLDEINEVMRGSDITVTASDDGRTAKIYLRKRK